MDAKKSSRHTPIDGTVTLVPGYHPTLAVYQIPGSPYWQVRCRLGGDRPRRSLEIAHKNDPIPPRAVIREAGDWFTEQLVKNAQNLPLVEHRAHRKPENNPSSFDAVANVFLEYEKSRVKNGEIAQSKIDNFEYMRDKDMLPFFGGIDVKEINFQKIQDYKVQLEKRDLGSETLKMHLFHLRGVLTHAVKVNLLTGVPLFPTIKGIKRKKIIGWFTKEEYSHLIKTIKDEVRKNIKVRGVSLTAEILYVTEFLLNSFLRTPDLYHLKNKQIAINKDQGYKVLLIRPDAKVSETIVVSLPECVDVYERLLKLHKPSGLDGLDNYVFFPEYDNRTYAKETMRRQFNHCLDKCKLKKAVNGEIRTLYSLRHTRLMFSFLDNPNLDLITMAQNARTGMEMLRDHYLKHAQNQMNVEKITGIKTPESVKRANEKKRKAEHLTRVLENLLEEGKQSKD